MPYSSFQTNNGGNQGSKDFTEHSEQDQKLLLYDGNSISVSSLNQTNLSNSIGKNLVKQKHKMQRNKSIPKGQNFNVLEIDKCDQLSFSANESKVMEEKILQLNSHDHDYSNQPSHMNEHSPSLFKQDIMGVELNGEENLDHVENMSDHIFMQKKNKKMMQRFLGKNSQVFLSFKKPR